MGEGYQSNFNNRSTEFQWTVKIGLLVCSFIVLAVYSLIFYMDGSNKMGIITSVSIVLMDLYSLLLFKTKMVESPVGMVFLMILNRCMMIAYGDGFWIYGYMILFVVYACALSYLIAKNRYPFEGDVVKKNAQIENMLKF